MCVFELLAGLLSGGRIIADEGKEGCARSKIIQDDVNDYKYIIAECKEARNGTADKSLLVTCPPYLLAYRI